MKANTMLSFLKGLIFENNKQQSHTASSVVSSPHSTPYVILDVETTGLNPQFDKIIQLSAIKYDIHGTPIDFYDTYLNPKCPIPPQISRLTGITETMVSKAPCAYQIQHEFLSFIGDALILGYNVTFDLRFLNHTFEDCFWGREYVDVLAISRQLLYLPNYKLETVATNAGFNPKASFHNSLTDCEAVAAILHHIGVDFDDWIKTFRPSPPLHTEEPAFHFNDAGFKFWMQGDTARKNGDFETALQLFAKAREAGYACPVIYESYAMAYRKLKDYGSEISILDEAITSFDGPTAESFQTRKNRAMALLCTQQQKEHALQEKAFAKAKKADERQQKKEQEKLKPKQPSSRPVLQCSDDGIIIKKHSSVASAAQETGVNPKCIRDTANGKQKHAGGFCWKYATSDTLDDATVIS